MIFMLRQDLLRFRITNCFVERPLRFYLHVYIRCCLSIFLLLAFSLSTAHTQWQPTENLPVCTADNTQYFPVLTTDGEEGVIVAWRDARNGNYDIYAQRVSSNGDMVWKPDGISVCDHAAAQSAPIIVSDLKGGAILVWGDMRNGTQDSYAQRIDVNGKKLWNPDGIEVCKVAALQDDFTAIADGSGGVIVVWEDWRSGNQDIYAQKVSADGKVVWKQNGIAVITDEGDQYDPTLISDGKGGAIIV